MSFYSKTRRSALRLTVRVRSFCDNARGVAALEFAMLVPILVAAFLGCFEFSQAITVNRRVTNVASEAGDLVAQTASLVTSDMNDIMNITTTILKPYDPTKIKVAITSVTANATSGAVTVDWSVPFQGGPTYTAGQPYPGGIPAGLITNGQSLIIAETSYLFKPAYGQYLTGGITLGDKFYLSPRKGVPCVQLDPPANPCRT